MRQGKVEVAPEDNIGTPHLLDLAMLRKAIAENGIDRVLAAMIVVCQIETRSLEGVKGAEAEQARWRDRVHNLKAYKRMAMRVEGRDT